MNRLDVECKETVGVVEPDSIDDCDEDIEAAQNGEDSAIHRLPRQ